MDILGKSYAPYVQGDSLPGSIFHRPGGVARNIAAFLRNLGVEVELVCALGNDHIADQLKTACFKLGIGLTYAIQTDYPSPTYLAIHDDAGEVVCAINDMRAMEEMTPASLSAHLEALNMFDACVLDANLSTEALAYLAESLHIPLIADPVSAVKSKRLLPILDKLTALKPNLMEAQALAGEQEMRQSADCLLKAGVKQIFISLGRDGVYYTDGKDCGRIGTKLFPGTTKTGAGDAMTAGIALAIAQGSSVKMTAQKGIYASTCFLESENSTI